MIDGLVKTIKVSAQVLAQNSTQVAAEKSGPWGAVVEEFWQLVDEIWMELVVVAVCLALLVARSIPSLDKGTVAMKQKRAPLAPKTAVAKLQPDGPADKGQCRPAQQETVQRQVRQLAATLADKSTDATALYQDLVATHGSQLRDFVSDDQARTLYLALISHAANTGRERLQGIIGDMQELGFPRNLAFYASVMKLYTTMQQYRDVLRIHDLMAKDGVEPDRMMYICLLNAAIACDESDKALQLFGTIVKLGVPSVRTYMTILRVHTKRGDWMAAAKLLTEMKDAGAKPDNLVLNHVLGLCVQVGQLPMAEEVAKTWWPLVDVVSCNILLKGCAQKADSGKAEALLQQMLKEGPEPNLISLNTVMDCSVRSLQLLSSPHDRRKARMLASAEKEPSDPDGVGSNPVLAVAKRPWELLDMIVERGLTPDRYTCSTLVKGMHLAGCSVVEIDRVVALLKRVGSHALQDDASTGSKGEHANSRLLEVLFNTLLDACVTAKDLDRMAEIFSLMRSFKAGVSAVTFGTLIKAFGQAGKLNRCLEVWEEMGRAQLRPTAVTYGCLIDACLRNDDLDEAMRAFERMPQDGVTPNAVIYTSLIRGFARAGQPLRALKFYREMRERSIDATTVTFNSVLDIIARQLSEPQKLTEVIEDMRVADVAPDVITYSILIKASCNAGKLDNALMLFDQLRDGGLAFDTVAFNTLLLACSKAGRISDAERLFEAMCRLNMTPTNVTISILVKMYGRARALDKAIAAARWMEREHNEAPNLFVYTCLIQACAQNGQVKRSWEIFNEMLRRGIEPDGITYGTMIHGCVYLNKFDCAMCLVRQAYLKAQPPAGRPESCPLELHLLQPQRVVPLQAEVLGALLASLRRKRQMPFSQELEDLMVEFHLPVPPEAKTPSSAERSPTIPSFMPAEVQLPPE